MNCGKGNVFVCPEEGCFSTFTTIQHLTTHAVVHSNERPFVCPSEDCPKTFKRQYHLQRHQLHCHEQIKQFSCDFEGCGKKFCSIPSMKRHKERIHDNPSYKCSICDVILSKRKQLQIHEAQHKEEKPFRCDVKDCSMAFATPSRLTAHQRKHKGYSCPVSGCSALFFKWSLLLVHKKVEHVKVYPCDKCKKEFHTKFNLKKHVVVHSETRQVHHCPLEGCSRQYFDLKNLNTHLKRFHQKECFTCSQQDCHKIFAHKKSLLTHLELHANPKPVCKGARIKKKLYKFVKRRSAAAMLSGFEAERAEEKEILDKDQELTLAAVKQQLEEIERNVCATNQTLHPCLIIQNA